MYSFKSTRCSAHDDGMTPGLQPPKKSLACQASQNECPCSLCAPTVRQTFTTKRVSLFHLLPSLHSTSWNHEPLRTPASSIYSHLCRLLLLPWCLVGVVVVVLLFLWLIRPICYENIPVFILTTLASPENRRPTNPQNRACFNTP